MELNTYIIFYFFALRHHSCVYLWYEFLVRIITEWDYILRMWLEFVFCIMTFKLDWIINWVFCVCVWEFFCFSGILLRASINKFLKANIHSGKFQEVWYAMVRFLLFSEYISCSRKEIFSEWKLAFIPLGKEEGERGMPCAAFHGFSTIINFHER